MNEETGPRPVPDEVDPELAKVLGALRGPPTPEELRDQERYLQAFDELGPAPGRVLEPVEPYGRKPLRTIRIGAKAAAAVAVLLVAAVSAAAAYTGNLPRALQSSAHRLLGVQAPPATSSSTGPAVSPSGPSGGPGVSPTTLPPGVTSSLTPGGTGPAGSSGSAPSTALTPPTSSRPTPTDARGLCTAWSKGGLATTSTSYRRLVAVAGGSANVAAYCAGVLGSTPAASPSTTTHGRSAHPSKSPKKLKERKPRKSGKPGKRAAGRAGAGGRL